MRHLLLVSIFLVNTFNFALATISEFKIQEVNFDGSDLTFAFPLRSEAIGKSELPALTGNELPQTLKKDFDWKCLMAKQSTTRQTAFRDFTQSYNAVYGRGPVVELASCEYQGDVLLESEDSSESSFLTQASGVLKLKLNNSYINSRDKSEKRGLFHISIITRSLGQWGSIENAKSNFKQSCEGLKASVSDTESSIIFVHCPEPKIEIQCCANITLHGQIDFFVVSLANPILESQEMQAKTVAEVNALNASFIASQGKKFGKKFGFAYCTQPAFLYKTRNIHSQCYSLGQQAPQGNSDLYLQKEF